jgi:hypothetical protein
VILWPSPDPFALWLARDSPLVMPQRRTGVFISTCARGCCIPPRGAYLHAWHAANGYAATRSSHFQTAVGVS